MKGVEIWKGKVKSNNGKLRKKRVSRGTMKGTERVTGKLSDGK